MEARYLRVKNWGDFQHYRDKEPKWIKLYARLLHKGAFAELEEHVQWQLVRVWMVASQSERFTHDDDGRIVPVVADDERTLRRSISTLRKVPLAMFIREGWLVPVDEDDLIPVVGSRASLEPVYSGSSPLLDREKESSRELQKQVPKSEDLAAEPAATVTSLALRKRDDCWDFVVELKGEPLPRQRSGYGRIAADLRALLEREPAADWASELRRRHQALAGQWGDSKATPRSLVENWQIAGRIADGATSGPKPELTIEERMWKHAHRQGGELDAG